MIRAKAPLKLVALDAARHLDDDSAAKWVTAVLKTNGPDVALLDLGDSAGMKGMAQVAKDTCLGRESRYKAHAPRGRSRFETAVKPSGVLGAEFVAQAPAPPA